MQPTPMMGPKPKRPNVSTHFSIHALLYGDYPGLAAQCLESLYPLWETGAELRIGACAASSDTLSYVERYCQQANGAMRSRCFLLVEPGNPGKYPMMRRLFHEFGTLRRYVMWFDDDSRITSPLPVEWLAGIHDMLQTAVMVGAQYSITLMGRQHEWIRKQSWYRARPVIQAQQRVKFLTGGWWALQREIIEKYDLPLREAHHRGGDVMLGQLLQQQGLSWRHYNRGVAINADAAGRESQAERRGLSKDAPFLGING